MQGGIFAATSASAYMVTTLVVWTVLMFFSLRRFPTPPVPGAFNARHRFWRRLGMIWMLATGVTSLPVCFHGFAA